MGGSIPIVGATITLYAAGTTGYGSAPTVIGTSAPTDSNGYFSITRTGTCTDPQQLYIVTSGGTQSGVSNPKIVLFEALGTCSTVTSSTVVVINEATTVAGAYALAGFAKVDGSSINVGTTSSNQLGLQHAFANAQNLVTIFGTARAVTNSGNGVVPYAVINSLADALVACVDSNGSTGACNNIAVPPPPGTTTGTPTNAWQIALNWALYPTHNVSAVYNNQTPPYFFLPNLSSFPSDLSIAIAYNAGSSTDGGAATAPTDVKADANGNIWLSGMVGAPLVEFASDGTILSPNGGFGSAALKAATLQNLALDFAIDSTSPTVWVADSGGNVFSYAPSTSVTTQYALPTSVIRNGGTPASPSTRAKGIGLDSAGDVWFSTAGTLGSNFNYVGEIKNTAGTFTMQTSYTGNPFPSGNTLGSSYLAINTASGAFTSNAIVTNNDSTNTGEYFAAPYTGNDTQTSNLVNTGTSKGSTFDSAGDLWMLGDGNGSNGGRLCHFTAFNSATCHSVPGAHGQDGLDAPTSVATDGIGRFFMLSNTTVSVIEYDTTAGFIVNSSGNGFSPISASGGNVLSGGNIINMTIDSAGAIWVANTSNIATPVVQILGPGAPTVAPLSLGKYGVRP